MGDIIGLLCEKLTGHRFDAWVQVDDEYMDRSLGRLEFERGRCRWCRQWYIRAMLVPWRWTEETDQQTD